MSRRFEYRRKNGMAARKNCNWLFRKFFYHQVSGFLGNGLSLNGGGGITLYVAKKAI
jgi:hypothetical protein